MEFEKYKKDLPYSYTFGFYPTIELLEKAPKVAGRIIFHSKSNHSEGKSKILDLVNKLNIKTETNDRQIEKVSPKENCFAVGIFKKFQNNINTTSNHVVLVNPENAGNLGTIIRTMVSFGFNDLAIIKPGIDIFSPEVVRSSMGSIFSIKFSYFEDFDSYKQRMGIRNYFFFFTNGQTELNSTEFKNPYSLVFGSESKGLDTRFLTLGNSVKIPQANTTDSLNLAVASGIVLSKLFQVKG